MDLFAAGFKSFPFKVVLHLQEICAKSWRLRESILRLQVGFADVEAEHFVAQGGAFEAEALGGAAGAGDFSSGGFEGVEDGAALGFAQRGGGARFGVQGGEGRFAKFMNRDAQLLALSEDDRALDKILQLAHVAGPGGIGKRVHGFTGNAANVLLHFSREAGDEVVDEQGNIFAALAQGRNLDRKDVEAIEEIFAKEFFANHGG